MCLPAAKRPPLTLGLLTSRVSPQSSSPRTEAVKEPADPSENPGASSGRSEGVPGAPIPTIIVSEYKASPEEVEKTEPEPRSADAGSEDKADDGDNPLTHFKMIFKGLARSRSQESLSSTKTTSEEDPPHSDVSPHCSQNAVVRGESSEGSTWRHFNARLNKKEKTGRLTGGATKRGGTLPRGEEPQCHKSQASWEQMEATKAILDLLKEISGWFSGHTCDSLKNSRLG